MSRHCQAVTQHTMNSRLVEPRISHEISTEHFELEQEGAEIMQHIGILRRPLNHCVFLTFEWTTPPKSTAEGTEKLHGIIGLHVDNFIGLGVALDRIANDGWEHVPYDVPCFLSHLGSLSKVLEQGRMHLRVSFSITVSCLCDHASKNTWKMICRKPQPYWWVKSEHPQAETAAEEKHLLPGLKVSMK